MAILRSPANAEKNKRGFLLQTLPAPSITDLAFPAPLPLPRFTLATPGWHHTTFSRLRWQPRDRHQVGELFGLEESVETVSQGRT